MEDNIWKIIIGALGVIAGAVITALASAYSARQKTREIEILYEQKLRESYLANARQYIGPVYIPLSVALSEFSDSYLHFRNGIQSVSDEKGVLRKDFTDSYLKYKTLISDLLTRGADAYLTSEFDNKLQSFNSFLESSMSTQLPIYSRVIEYAMYMPGIGAYGDTVTMRSDGSRFQKVLTSVFGDRYYKLKLFPFARIVYRKPDLLMAPIDSLEFEEYMIDAIRDLKSLIKEVTLGSQVAKT